MFLTCHLTKTAWSPAFRQKCKIAYILQFLSNFVSFFYKIPNTTKCECIVKIMPLEVQVKQFLKENIICNGDMSLLQKGRLLHKIFYNQGILKVKETRNESNFCKEINQKVMIWNKRVKFIHVIFIFKKVYCYYRFFSSNGKVLSKLFFVVLQGSGLFFRQILSSKSSRPWGGRSSCTHALPEEVFLVGICRERERERERRRKREPKGAESAS